MSEGAARSPVTHTHIGGQALIEGVMMRGKLNWAVAVRTPSGAVHVEEHDLPQRARAGWRTWPLLRGGWAMWESLSLAMKAFAIAAQYAVPESVREDQPGTGEDVQSGPAAAGEPEGLSTGEVGFALVLGVVLAVGVFIVLPAFATNWLVGDATVRPFLWNVVDGVLRLLVFFAYIAAVGLIPDIRRVFAYHGAEHKSIHAYERGLPLETDVVQRYGTLHVRCGTSFLLMVMVIAIVVFSLVPGRVVLGALGIEAGRVAITAFNIAIRILLLPVVAGIAYEVTVKWAGTRPDNPLVKVLLWPGLQLQRLTTREPSDDMVEVAVAALRAVADREEREAKEEGAAVAAS